MLLSKRVIYISLFKNCIDFPGLGFLELVFAAALRSVHVLGEEDLVAACGCFPAGVGLVEGGEAVVVH